MANPVPFRRSPDTSIITLIQQLETLRDRSPQDFSALVLLIQSLLALVE